MKRHGLTKRLLATVMTSFMALSLIPNLGTPLQVYAEEPEWDKNIVGFGTSNIANPVAKKGRWSYIYYGNYDGEHNTRYRVLTNNTRKYDMNNNTQSMFVDAEHVLYYEAFDDDSNVWAGSNIQSKLNGSSFLNKSGNFTDIEKDAILSSYQTNYNNLLDGVEGTPQRCSYAPLVNAKIFLLDMYEIYNTKYGFDFRYGQGDVGIVAKKNVNGEWDYFWTRNTYDNFSEPEETDKVYCIYYSYSESKMVIRKYDNSEIGVSPSFNIKCSSVVAISLLSGKTGYQNAEYKLTLLDNNINLAAENTITPVDNKLYIPYSITGSHANDATHLSVVITDKSRDIENAKVMHYTKYDLNEISRTGTLEYTIPDDFAGGWKIYLIAEKINGEKETDYSSEPVEITIPHTEHDFSYEAGTGNNRNKIYAICNNPYCDLTNSRVEVSFSVSNNTYSGGKPSIYLNVPSTTYDEIEPYPEKSSVVFYKSTGQGSLEADGDALPEAPKNAGYYVAELSWGGATARYAFRIYQKSVTVSGITSNNKEYDGNTSADVDYSGATFSGVVSGDDVSCTATGEYEDADAGENKTVNLDITLTGESIGNYVLSSSSQKTATSSISPLEAEIKWGDETDFTYDGTEKVPTATVDNLIGEDTCDVTVDGAETNANADGESYTATVSALSNSNYKLPEDPVTTSFTIAKAASAGALNAVTGLVYDGEEKELVSVAEESVIGGTIQYRLGTDGEWSGSIPKGTDAGTYNVYFYVKADDSGNYTDGGSESDPLGPVEVEIAKTNFEGITADDYVGIYDGTGHGITVNVDRTKYPDAVITYCDTEDGTYTENPVEFEEVTDGAKTVYYKVSADNYNDFSGSATVTVNPRPMTGVASENIEKDYDGNPAKISVSVTTPKSFTVTYKTTADGEYTSENPEFILPGEYTVYYKVSADHYADTEGSATIKINPIDIAEDEITADPYEGEYDYKAHGITVNVPDMYKGAKITYSLTEDGTYTEEPLSFTDVTNGAKTVYYKVSCDGYNEMKGSSTVTITPKEMTVSSLGQSVEYDGTPVSISVNVYEPDSGATVLYKGPDDEEFTSTNPEFTYPGNYQVDYKVTHPNFKEYTGSANIVIKKAVFPSGDVTVTNYSGIYDGNTHSVSAVVDTTKYPDATVTYSATLSGVFTADPLEFTDATDGVKTVYYKISATGYYDKIGTATVEITPKAMIVAATGIDNKIYDKTAASITVNVTEPAGALVEYKGPDDSSFSSTNPEFVWPGEYEVTYRVTADNYQTVESTAVVKIKPATMTGITSNSYTGVYDGQPHGITVNVGDAYENAIVKYSESSSGGFSTTPITVTDVEDSPKTIWFTVECKGYSTAIARAYVTITEADATVTPEASQSKTYGDIDPEFEYKVTGLIGNDTLAGALSREEGKDVGEYAYTIGTLDSANSNYRVSLADEAPKFEIKTREIEIEWSGTLIEASGEEQSPVAAVKNSDTELTTGDDVKVVVSGAKTEVGKYTAEASLEGEDAGNYVIKEDTKSVSFEIIDKSALSSDIIEAENYYDSIKDSYPEIAEALKEAIDAAKAVAENADAVQTDIDEVKAALKAAVETAEADVETTDKETEAKNKEEFENEQSEMKAEIDKLIDEEDSEASKKFIEDAKAAVDALEYDTTKTPEENKSELEKIISELKTSLDEQRKADEEARKAAEEAEKKAAEEAEKKAAEEAAKKAAEELEAAKKTAEIALYEKASASVKSKKIQVTWKKIDVADGYEVYAQYVGKQATEPEMILESNATTSASITKIGGKKLNLKKNYYVYVSAYKMVDGKKVTLADSMKLYLAGIKSKSYTNVKSMKLKKSKISVKVGKTAKIKTTVKLVKKNKKVLPKKICAKLRYRSSDESIATVTSSGKIKGVKAGTCVVYVYSANGLVKKVKVTVK